MASYRLLYNTRENIRNHPWASIYVPAALILYAIFALYMSPTSKVYVTAMSFVGSVYLAWHYTGQAWGMMASFGYLSGIRLENKERLIIRFGLRILLVWHVFWFLQFFSKTTNAFPEWVHDFTVTGHFILNCVSPLAVISGLYGFFLVYKRTGRLPTIRMLLPWIAIFVWYAAIYRDERLVVWVQIAHGIQYLIFPARVEYNRCLLGQKNSRWKAVQHMFIWAIVLILTGTMYREILDGLFFTPVEALFGKPAIKSISPLMLAFLNIHHYFIDGCVWKISNPRVSRELFAHIPKPEAEQATVKHST